MRDVEPVVGRCATATARTVPSVALFDLDGVLVDSRPGIRRSLDHTLASIGVPAVDDDVLDGLIGPPLVVGLRGILPALGRDPSEAEALVATYRRHYATSMVEHTTLQPGIADALSHLSARIPLAVATSKSGPFAETLLVALGVRAHFAVVVGPDPGAHDERKGETIGRALDLLTGALGRRPQPGATVMVGDRHHDVTGAAEHGLQAIGVSWGYGSTAELRDAGATAVVDDVDALVALLLEGW
jgi:phosphoglycolate phosphatase